MNKATINTTLFLALGLLVNNIALANPEAKEDYMHIWYAKQFKVSLHEAKRRHRVSNIASKVATVFDSEKALFSGIIIKNDSPYRIIFEVKRFDHCENIKYTPLFKTDKRCNIVTRINDKLRSAKIISHVDVVFVKHSKLDQERLQSRASYYANRYAKNKWSTIGWNAIEHRIEIGVLNKENFKNKLLAANIFLPPEIFVKEVKALMTLH